MASSSNDDFGQLFTGPNSAFGSAVTGFNGVGSRSFELLESPSLPMLGTAFAPVTEDFRRLKTLLCKDDRNPNQVLLVTSPIPGDGKSLVALNLALTLATDVDQDTLLIDADLRKIGLAQFLRPRPRVGLSELLRGTETLAGTLCRLKNSPLHILPGGACQTDPGTLLASQRFRDLLSSLRSTYQRILIDTPPVVPFSDAITLAGESDGVLVVLRSGQTPQSLAKQALDSLRSTRIAGIVLNSAAWNLADRHRHYDKYYYRYFQQRSGQ